MTAFMMFIDERTTSHNYTHDRPQSYRGVGAGELHNGVVGMTTDWTGRRGGRAAIGLSVLITAGMRLIHTRSAKHAHDAC